MKHLRLAIFALGLISSCSGSVEPTQTQPTVSVEAVTDAKVPTRFTVEVVGSGPDIFLIPGLASHPETFATTVEQLQDRFTLHTLHVAGFAGAPAAGNQGQDDILIPLAEEIVAYANTLNGRPRIIGHSLGGLTAMAAALTDTEAFEAIMVIDVLPFFSVLIDPDATEESIAPTAAFLKATLLGQPDEVYEIRQREALDALTKSDEALQKSLQWSLETDRSVMAEAMHDVLTTDLRFGIQSLNLPITILYARDPDVPNMERVEQQYFDAYGALPNARLRPVDGALHFIMYDKPEAYRDEVEAFLE